MSSVTSVPTRRRAVQWPGAALGVAVLLGGGLLAGSWWWVAAGLGSAAGVGAVVDRHLGNAQVVAALVLVAGVVAAGHDWYVVVLAAGTIGAIELLAAADRLSVVRTQVPDLGRVGRVVPFAAVLAAAALVVGAVSTGMPAGGALGAAVAAVLALRVIAR